MRKFLLLFSLTCLHILSFQQLLAQTAPSIQWNKNFGGSGYDYLYDIKRTNDGGYILGGGSFSDSSGEKSQNRKGGRDFWIVKIDSIGNKLWDKTIGGNRDDELLSLAQTSDGGYILGGYSASGISGDKSQASIGLFPNYWVVKLDANGNKLWDKTFNGNHESSVHSLIQTIDGGYLIGGQASLSIMQGSKGGWDYWLIKLDPSGNILWNKVLGGNFDDHLRSIIQTSDGGYAIGGYSNSGISNNKSQACKGGYDYWIVKLDSVGTILWDKTIGGDVHDELTNLYQTTDGGYILGGSSYSGISGDKTHPNYGGPNTSTRDYWIVKLNASGNILWEKTIGGGRDETLASLIQTTDGGYILGGSSYSYISGDKSEDARGTGLYDYWLVKTDAGGTKIWDKTIGGYPNDILKGICQTPDGGYILGGYSESGPSGDNTQVNRGLTDYWVVKLGPEILGIKDDLLSRINLYPNPTSGLINLELNDQQVNWIGVYNTLGQCILTINLPKTSKADSIQLDLSKQAKGVYTIQILSDSQVITRKVILE